MKLHLKDPGSAITHFIGMLMALFAAFPLLIKAAAHSDNRYLFSMAIFIFSMIARIFSKLADCSFMYMNDGIELIPAWSNRPLYTYYWLMVIIFGLWTTLCYLPFVIKAHRRKNSKWRTCKLKINAIYTS